jgi:hypothetical protein
MLRASDFAIIRRVVCSRRRSAGITRRDNVELLAHQGEHQSPARSNFKLIVLIHPAAEARRNQRAHRPTVLGAAARARTQRPLRRLVPRGASRLPYIERVTQRARSFGLRDGGHERRAALLSASGPPRHVPTDNTGVSDLADASNRLLTRCSARAGTAPRGRLLHRRRRCRSSAPRCERWRERPSRG